MKKKYGLTSFLLMVALLAISQLAWAIGSTTVSTSKTTVSYGESYTISWTAVSGVTRYLLQEATNSSFSGATTYFHSSSSRSRSFSYNSTVKYYYRVISDNENTGESSFSTNTVNVQISNTSSGDPTADISIIDDDCPQLYNGQSFCCSLRIKNNGSTCYPVTYTDADARNISVSWSDDSYSTDFTLCGGSTKWVGDFCGIPSGTGILYINLDLTINGTEYSNVDEVDFLVQSPPCNNTCTSGSSGCTDTNTRWTCAQDAYGCWYQSTSDCSSGYVCSSGSCIQSCTNECTSGATGCNGTTQRWTCGEANDGDACLDKIYYSCSGGQVCSAGSCVTPDNPPIISDNSFDQLSEMVLFKLVDVDGDLPYIVEMWLYDAWGNFINIYTMDQSVGTNPVSGIWYSYTFSGLADGTYKYLAVVYSGNTYLYPESGFYQFTKTSCLDECTSGATGCNGTTQRWTCGEANDGDVCLDKIYTTCQSGYVCSSGSCIQSCTNECTSGSVGCNGTTQRWTCGEANDGDLCLDKIYYSCSGGQVCSNGSCIIPNSPPVLSDADFDNVQRIFVIKYVDPEGVDPVTIDMYLYKDGSLYDVIALDPVIGSDPAVGVWYGKNLAYLPAGNYSYFVNAEDGPNYDIFPDSGTLSFIIPACNNVCTLGAKGCVNTTQYWACEEDDFGCLYEETYSCSANNYCTGAGSCVACNHECNTIGEIGCSADSTQSWVCTTNANNCRYKAYTACGSGYQCSNGSCVALPALQVPALTSTFTVVRSNSWFWVSWGTISNITRYDLQEAQNSSFTSNLATWQINSGSMGFSTRKTVTQLTSFYYRIRAVNANTGQTSSWSNTVMIKVDPCADECSTAGQTGCVSSNQSWTCGEADDGDICLDLIYDDCSAGYACKTSYCENLMPPAPTLIVNYNQVYYGEPFELTWNDIGADSYGVYESDRPDGLYPISYFVNTALSWQFTKYPETDHTYYYQVKGYNSFAGVTYSGAKSNIVAVQVLEDPLVATLSLEPDVVWTNQEVKIFIDSDKPIGVELGFGDGMGFSYLTTPNPITWSYGEPGVYRVEAKVIGPNSSITLAAYLVVNTDWNTYDSNSTVDVDAVRAYRNILNSSVLQKANGLLGGGQ